MTWRKWLLIAAVVLLIVAVGGGLYVRSWIGSDAGEQIVAALQERLQVPVSAESVEVELGKILLMTPSVTLRGLTIGNPEGFTSPHLLHADQVSAQLRLGPLASKRLEIPDFSIFSPDVNLERNPQGRSNLQMVMERASQREASASAAGQESPSWTLSIQRLSLQSGSFSFIDRRSDTPQTTSAQEIDLELSDFSPGQSSPFTLSAKLFGGQRSGLDFQGHAGPFARREFPMQGALTLNAALQEMDRETRLRLLGNLLGEPGEDSLARLQVDLQGDAAQSLAGQGTLALSDFYLGKNQDKRLPARGELPITLTARNLLDAPRVTVQSQDGSFQLGQGTWKGQLQFEIASGGLSGSSRGQIEDIDINQLLSAFTESEDKVFGTLRVPEYQMQFQGADAQQIQDSLRGEGQFVVKSGRIAAFGLIDRLRRALNPQQARAETATEFDEIASPFQIENRRFRTPDLRLASSALTLTAQGDLGFDRSLDYRAQLDLRGGLESILGPQAAAMARFLPQGKIPMKISGSFDDPKLEPDLSGGTQGAIRGLLEQFLRPKKEEKQEPPEQQN
ncbi:MAG TPA: AsmA-like C-terminal region-containing protein [Acidobacteriota bacterium]|nr:AsmA-like C-terminal region-containing protein [Acidobacteriota bacterium]